MSNTNIDLVLENQSMKFEFQLRGLDLSQVFRADPDHLERENKLLRRLLDWVEKYAEYGDRATMEAFGYRFPPIYPGISPDNDWFRFEEWIQGEPIRQKLDKLLPAEYSEEDPNELTDEEIAVRLKRLELHLQEFHIGISIREGVPPRLLYVELLDFIKEEFDTIQYGGFFFDGCSGYCPGCFQRPWCEMGNESCWREDEEAGKMHLIDSVKTYVSATPISLPILQAFQAEEDRRMEEFLKNRPNRDTQTDLSPFSDLDEFDSEDGIPF